MRALVRSLSEIACYRDSAVSLSTVSGRALSRVCARDIQGSRGNAAPWDRAFCRAECNSTYFLFTRHLDARKKSRRSPGFARSVGVIQLISWNSGLAVPTRRLPLGSIASCVIHGVRWNCWTDRQNVRFRLSSEFRQSGSSNPRMYQMERFCSRIFICFECDDEFGDNCIFVSSSRRGAFNAPMFSKHKYRVTTNRRGSSRKKFYFTNLSYCRKDDNGILMSQQELWQKSLNSTN